MLIALNFTLKEFLFCNEVYIETEYSNEEIRRDGLITFLLENKIIDETWGVASPKIPFIPNEEDPIKDCVIYSDILFKKCLAGIDPLDYIPTLTREVFNRAIYEEASIKKDIGYEGASGIYDTLWWKRKTGTK